MYTKLNGSPSKSCFSYAVFELANTWQDALFEKMTFQEWTSTISSKVHSSWNLHKLLPTNLSFFILLSSIAGLGGTIGQSNYAAGNTFQDALCLHRVSQGQNAISLRLGIMGDIGIVSEKDEYFKNKEKMVDMAAVTEKEFLALLDRYCNPALGLLSPQESLPIIGLVTPAQLLEQGLETPYWLQRPTFSPLAQIGLTSALSSVKDTKTENFAADLRGTSCLSDAKDVVLNSMVSRLSRALAIPMNDIDTSKPLHAYGVDSLFAVELRNWFAKELASDVAVFDIMNAESMIAMSTIVALKSSNVSIKE